MIELKNIIKTYSINKKTECTALNGVSLTLPDSGMIFIIGKSGSGKSTLLNLIGGLDIPTSGTIISDGNEISKFKQKDLTKYRSSYVGFIFQDYHVLDSFTVRQNINLSLDIKNEIDNEKVDQLLDIVELKEYEDRYPSELSGGQKQRIAVARALVKDANVILCDEPTGNLDKNTSKQILDLLKKISKERLVVVVSHNMVEANNYADRIIELYDGIIVRDRSRSSNYSNEFRISDDVIYIPHYRDLTNEELDLINEEIKNNDNIIVKQIGNRFVDTKIPSSSNEKFEIQSSLVNRKTSKKLFKTFFKGKAISITISVFLAAVLLTCFAIFQSFLNFDGNKEISNSLTKYNIYTVPLQKGVQTSDGLGLTYIKHVDDEDIQAFYDNGFNGNIYKKYTSVLPIGSAQNSIDRKYVFPGIKNVSSFYLKETFGVINSTESFVSDMYGVYNEETDTKEIKYLAVCEEQKDYGIFITDYIADSILIYRYKNQSNYDKLLGTYYYSDTYYGYINGIIYTGYKEKYPNLVKTFEEQFANPTALIDASKIKETDEFSNFLLDVINYLGFGYSFVDDYQEAIKTTEFRSFFRLCQAYLEIDEDHQGKVENLVLYDCAKVKNLGPNEIILSKTTVSSLFPFIDQNNFEPFEMDIVMYKNSNKTKTYYKKTFTVVGINTSYSYVNMNENMDLRDIDVIPYGIYLDSFDNFDNVLETADDLNYIICSADATKLVTVNKVLSIFGKFFLFIEVLFLIVCVIFIVNIGISSVKKNRYEIGVLKAIGTSSFDIMRIYIRQTLIICLAICVVTNIGIAIGTFLSNVVLVEAFERILDTTFFELRLIRYIPKIVFTDLICICIISAISFVIPQIMLFKIKPIDIIRAKE